jgi:hypothetical protein
MAVKIPNPPPPTNPPRASIHVCFFVCACVFRVHSCASDSEATFVAKPTTLVQRAVVTNKLTGTKWAITPKARTPQLEEFGGGREGILKFGCFSFLQKIGDLFRLRGTFLLLFSFRQCITPSLSLSLFRSRPLPW